MRIKMYDVFFSPVAEKFFKKLKDKNLKLSFKDALDKICDDPYIGEAKKGDLLGIYGYDVKYARTNYEIAYKIFENGENRIIVVLVGSRENFYEQLKRYYK